MIFLKRHDKIGIIYNECEISYEKIVRYSKSFGQRLDIKKEDKVMIFMENRPELVYSFFGTWDREGTCVTVDSSFTDEELEYYISDCDPKYIFTSKMKLETVKKAIKLSEKNVKILIVEDILMDYMGNDLTVSLDDVNMVAIMLYTSGTTGKPKGVMLTLDNLLVNMEGLREYNMYRSDDRILGLLPMHHILPLLGSGILPLVEGATLVFLKEVSSQAMLDALKKYKITFIVGVPKLWEVLHKKIMGKINSKKITKFIFKMASKINNERIRKKIFKKVHEELGGGIRFLVSGGSKLDSKIASDFLTLGIDICEGYGLTETAPMISFTPVGEIVPGSAGRLLSGIEVKTMKDGEIVVRGRNVMKGYYNRPEATAEVIDDKGWFHTGDLGEIRGRQLYVTGRKKEMIVLSNGKNINPIEIEQYLMKKTDLIKEVAIMDYEGKLTALIYPDFYKLHENEITNILETFKLGVIEEYNKTAPKYRKILDVKISKQEFPKTKIGKIRRFMLKDLINNKIEKVEECEEPTFEEYTNISNYIKDLKNKKVTPKAHFELDLGMDSLDIVEFVSYVEATFGVTIDEKIFIEHCTVESLANYVAKHSNEILDIQVNWHDRLMKLSKEELPKSNIIGKIFKYMLKIIFLFYIRINREGTEKLEKNGPVIFAGNHQSFLDAFLLNQVFPDKILDKTYYFAKLKHFEKNYMKFMGENSNVILVDINKNLIGSMQMLAKALKEGKNIVIFPEGTRTRDGKLGTFKKFFAILSKELNIPIQPFVIDGAYKLYPRNSKFPRSGEVRIKFLDKVYPEEGISYEKFSEKLEKIIQKELEK
ncbi:AMP-binding protein [Fusobacterium sp. MFO224]|uniref:AMP-binding protein n=1 Tax=Fusobacterium sp. MFO224 TaxID=3378070 RepID=UPI0038522FCF